MHGKGVIQWRNWSWPRGFYSPKYRQGPFLISAHRERVQLLWIGYLWIWASIGWMFGTLLFNTLTGGPINAMAPNHMYNAIKRGTNDAHPWLFTVFSKAKRRGVLLVPGNQCVNSCRLFCKNHLDHPILYCVKFYIWLREYSRTWINLSENVSDAWIYWLYSWLLILSSFWSIYLSFKLQNIEKYYSIVSDCVHKVSIVDGHSLLHSIVG